MTRRIRILAGLAHAVGSSADAIDSAIVATEQQFKANRVPVKVRIDGKHR